MHTRVTPIDISNNPELMRLTEEVARTKKPRELMRERETVAILMPATAKAKPKKKRVKTQADYEAFRAAAGSWKDMDVKKFKADISESRRLGSRPPIKL